MSNTLASIRNVTLQIDQDENPEKNHTTNTTTTTSAMSISISPTHTHHHDDTQQQHNETHVKSLNVLPLTLDNSHVTASDTPTGKGSTLRQRLKEKIAATSRLHHGNAVHQQQVVQLQHLGVATADPWIVTPDLLWVRMWMFQMMIWCCYNTISVTLRMTVGYDKIEASFIWVNAVDLVADLCFALHIVLVSRLAYDEHGSFIMSAQRIWDRYKSTTFMWDIVSLTPFIDWILLGLGLPFPSLCLRLGRLIQLSHVTRYIVQLDGTPGVNILVVRLVKLLVYLFFVVHFVGCFWWTLALPHSFATGEGEYLPSQHRYHMALHSRYIFCLYWSLGSMTGRFEEG
jgi:hypothetical protein